MDAEFKSVRKHPKFAIVGVPSDYNLEDVKKELLLKLKSVEDLQIKNQKKKSRATIICSTTDEEGYKTLIKARTVKLGFRSFKIEKARQLEAIQCFNCQKYGHAAKICTAETKCPRCSGPHIVKSCKEEALKCANCGGKHRANSAKCKKNPKNLKSNKVKKNEVKKKTSKKNVSKTVSGSGQLIFCTKRNSSYAEACKKGAQKGVTREEKKLDGTLKEEISRTVRETVLEMFKGILSNQFN